MIRRRVGIVGAGVGGLATAARLASRGVSVDVFEKLAAPGGRNHMLSDAGFKFDMGPSFVLMPDLFEEVFTYCGERLADYLDLRALDPSYKIFFPDGDTFTVFKDSRRTRDELERIEKGAGRGFDGFVAETARIYDRVRPLLYKCFTPWALVQPRYWPLIRDIRVLESYWGLAKKFFSTEKLRYAFTFEAMFMGVSPFDAPAFYSVISYADHVQKIFHPMGGMYEIPLALARLAGKYGARFHYDSEVTGITRRGSSLALGLKDAEREFDSVVANADYAYTSAVLLGRRLPRYKYSCSVYLLYLGLKQKLPAGLAHHNLFFSRDLKKNLAQIFKGQIFPDDPSFYIHVPTLTDPSLAPAGKDLVYILIPVPNLENPRLDIAAHRQRLRRLAFEKIERLLGVDLQDLIEVEHAFYPEDFIRRYHIHQAATFGLAHNLGQSAFLRPANIDNRMKGLYHVGASTQPGGGLPVVIAGSRIVADALLGQS